jgi:two-component system sensor histidine kinase KdpD
VDPTENRVLRKLQHKDHPMRMEGTIDAGKHRGLPRRASLTALYQRVLPYFAAVVVTAIALLVALLIKTELFVANVALIFLAGVVLCAARWGLMPALLACALSVCSLNFFFFPPIHDLMVDDPENVVAVLVFVGVAIFVARLTARARADARLAERRAMVTNKLYIFARQLTTIDDLDELLKLTAGHIAAALEVDAILLLPDKDVLTLRVSVPPIEALEPADMALAEQCWLRGQSDASALTGTSASSYLFLPLRTVGGTVGVLGLRQDGHTPLLTNDDSRFVEAMTDQVAVAIQRLTLAADVQRARVAAETESLRSAMLSAISHDLKTPLASILGAATSLGSYNSYFEQQQREDLVATIREEAERMSCFVANLLDITRVESGALEVRSEATDIEEVIGVAARRARRVLRGHRLNLRVAPDLPMLALDGVLLEQSLFNLLDNAAKYSPPQSTITVEAKGVGDRVMIKVMDEGPGIYSQDINRIFEKFYRSGHGRRQRAGTGLGLAISRGFVEAMGGRIIGGNRTDRPGAVFMIGFPYPEGPPLMACDGDDD